MVKASHLPAISLGIECKEKAMFGSGGVCPLLLSALNDALGVVEGASTPADDDLYELSTAVAAAERAHAARVSGFAQLTGSLSRAKDILARYTPNEQRKLAIFACLNESALIDLLEGHLGDEDMFPTLFGVLIDIDQHLLVARLLGVQIDPDFLRDALTLIRVHNDTAHQVSRFAQEMMRQGGVVETDPAFPLWQAVAESKPDPEHLEPETILPGLADWLEQEARKP